MIDKQKVLNGPFNLVLSTGSTEKYRIEGLKKDSITFGVENQVEELEDYSEDVYGRMLTAEVSFSELDITDLSNIEDETIDKIRIEFPVKGKYLEFSEPSSVQSSIDGLKTKIKIKKFVAGKDWTDVLIKGDLN